MSRYQVAFAATPTMSGIVVGLAAAMAISNSVGGRIPPTVPHVKPISQSSSSSPVFVTSTIGYMEANADAYSAVINFYGELSAAQTPLEPDFAKVLFDNLWDLYAE
jgi:hypothetical protein